MSTNVLKGLEPLVVVFAIVIPLEFHDAHELNLGLLTGEAMKQNA